MLPSSERISRGQPRLSSSSYLPCSFCLGRRGGRGELGNRGHPDTHTNLSIHDGRPYESRLRPNGGVVTPRLPHSEHLCSAIVGWTVSILSSPPTGDPSRAAPKIIEIHTCVSASSLTNKRLSIGLSTNRRVHAATSTLAQNLGAPCPSILGS